MRNFPQFPLSVNDLEKGMRFRIVDQKQTLIVAWTPIRKFVFQVLPFIQKLATGAGYAEGCRLRRYFVTIEGIPPLKGFIENGLEISGDRSERRGMTAKPGELGMAPVSSRIALQHFLRQQRLAPQSDESPRVKILWMKRPESHRFNL